ncbi:hypothetical protein NDU88_007142 [Pleurodeles waltl]|uniref:Uncharacterized protein n=1 Tax=Pleurodeles waltl TaxID=8319 RepID=A0AAV7UR29_PLEWA|nr:hypothetical protein NDU88_007142 [Pleurodeles waltl]
MDGARVSTSMRPPCPHNRGPRPQRALCSVAAAILGCGSRKVFGESFPGDLCSRVGRRGSYLPPVVIMAGFKLRAWIVVREHRTTRAAPLVPGHAPQAFPLTKNIAQA